jgi:chemotaxis protein methyltransferase CheR
MILFRHFNLLNLPYPVRENLDFVFCRNVMIYFDSQLRAKMAREFIRLLKPGGYLFVGHSESLTGLSTSLKCIRPSIYQKG